MDFTWQKDKRLLKRAEFLRCYEEGYKVHSRNFLAFIRIYEEQEVSEKTRKKTRVGFAVSKKVGNAVARNRVKRLLREYCRLNQENLPKCADIVITPKKHLHVPSLNYKKTEEELSFLLKKKP